MRTAKVICLQDSIIYTNLSLYRSRNFKKYLMETVGEYMVSDVQWTQSSRTSSDKRNTMVAHLLYSYTAMVFKVFSLVLILLTILSKKVDNYILVF